MAKCDMCKGRGCHRCGWSGVSGGHRMMRLVLPERCEDNPHPLTNVPPTGVSEKRAKQLAAQVADWEAREAEAERQHDNEKEEDHFRPDTQEGT